jgi:hypothetical protein
MHTRLRSTETALHQLVVRVEKMLDLKETALGGFLYIEGAFINNSYYSISAALARHGVSHTIIRWVRATLDDHCNSWGSPGISQWPRAVHRQAYCPPYSAA